MRSDKLIFLDFIYTFGGAQRSTSTLINALRYHTSAPALSVWLAPNAHPDFLDSIDFPVSELQSNLSVPLNGFKTNTLSKLIALVRLVPEIAAKLCAEDSNSTLVLLTNSTKGLVVISLLRLWYPKLMFKIAYYARGWGRKSEFRFITRWLIKLMVDGVFCVSESTKKNLISWGVKSDLIEVTYTSVDFSHFQPTVSHVYIPGDSLRILFLASLVPGKGLHILLDALCKLGEEYKIELVVAGDSPHEKYEQYKKRCEWRASQLPGNVRIFWKGWVRDVQQEINDADLLILPSQTEGMPRIIQEAMYLRRPVIASKVGGVLDLVLDGKTGYLIEELSPDGIAGKIKEICTQGIPSQVGEAAHDRIKEHFLLDSQIERFLSAYERLFS